MKFLLLLSLLSFTTFASDRWDMLKDYDENEDAAFNAGIDCAEKGKINLKILNLYYYLVDNGSISAAEHLAISDKIVKDINNCSRIEKILRNKIKEIQKR